MIADVRGCGLAYQGYALRFGQLRTFEALFAAVDRASSCTLAAAGSLGDAAVRDEVAQLQAGHAVVGGQDQHPQLLHDAQLDPLVPAAPQCRGGALLIGRAFVSAAEDEDLDQAVEDDLVRYPRVVTAKRMPVLTLGQQRQELVADRLEQA